MVCLALIHHVFFQKLFAEHPELRGLYDDPASSSRIF
jgi:hypothetical protein